MSQKVLCECEARCCVPASRGYRDSGLVTPRRGRELGGRVQASAVGHWVSGVQTGCPSPASMGAALGPQGHPALRATSRPLHTSKAHSSRLISVDSSQAFDIYGEVWPLPCCWERFPALGQATETHFFQAAGRSTDWVGSGKVNSAAFRKAWPLHSCTNRSFAGEAVAG